MTTPTTNGSGLAGDYLSALQRLLADGSANGLKGKVRVSLALSEGYGQQAAALERFASELQESGKYPPAVVERYRQAAKFLRAAGATLGEAGNELTSIANTPTGEVGHRAPDRTELVNSAR